MKEIIFVLQEIIFKSIDLIFFISQVCHQVKLSPAVSSPSSSPFSSSRPIKPKSSFTPTTYPFGSSIRPSLFQMQFLPGLEGSLGITSVTLCPKHRFLAVAERAERAIIFVYDMGKQRKKRALVTSDCLSQEYISLSFAPKQEKKFLISLGGPPD